MAISLEKSTADLGRKSYKKDDVESPVSLISGKQKFLLKAMRNSDSSTGYTGSPSNGYKTTHFIDETVESATAVHTETTIKKNRNISVDNNDKSSRSVFIQKMPLTQIRKVKYKFIKVSDQDSKCLEKLLKYFLEKKTYGSVLLLGFA